MSDNLELVQLAESQANKEVTINDQAAELDAALTDQIDVDLTDQTSPLVLAKSTALRALTLKLTGTNPGGGFEVHVPANRKAYALWNATADAVTVKTAAGSGVTVPAGKLRLVYCDAADVIDLAGAIAALGDIGDVALSGLAANHLLAYDGADWVNTTIAALLTLASLGDLGDVDLAGAADGQVLMRVGGQWVPADGGFAAPEKLLDASGDGSQTAFTLSAEPKGTLLVWIDGILQDETDDWSLAGTTLTFTAAPPAGTLIHAWDFGSNNASAVAPYDLALFLPGTYGDGALMAQVVFDRAVAFPVDLAGSQAFAATAATGQTVLDIQKNGSNIGTITFAASGQTGTFALAGGASFAAGDRLAIRNQSPADATLADVSITLKGTRS